MPNFFLRCLKWTAAVLIVAFISVPLFSSDTVMACARDKRPCIERIEGIDNVLALYVTKDQNFEIGLNREGDTDRFVGGGVGEKGEWVTYYYTLGDEFVTTSTGGRLRVTGINQSNKAEVEFERDPSLDVEGTGTGPGSYDNEKDCELAGYFWQEGNLGEGDRCVEKPSCATEIGQTGWIICPLLDAASGFADALWEIFETLMFTNPLQHDGVRQVWVKFRDVANALLVVVFIIIVMSQVSNIGISNYGIKKMLPRLVIVAVAVNISYVLLQVVVDLANIIGLTVDDFLNGVGLAAITDTVSWGAAIGSVLGGVALGVGGIAVTAFAITSGLAGPLLILIALLMLPAILAFIAGLVALMFRAAILPILAVLAPIALVAYVLPNTQSIFDKWRKLFTGLLFLYPLAAIYYGGLKMGAFIISGTMGWLGPIVAVFVLFFGAGAVVILAIKSNSIAGKAFGAVSGLLGKAAAPVQKLGKDVARDKSMDFTHGEARGNRLARFAQRKAKGFSDNSRRRSGRQSAFAEIDKQDYLSRIAANPQQELGDHILTTPTGKRFIQDSENKRVDSEVTDISSMPGIDETNKLQFASSEFVRANASGDKERARAAARIMMGGGSKGIQQLHDSVNHIEQNGGFNSEVEKEIRSDVVSAGLKGKDATLASWAFDRNRSNIQDLERRGEAMSSLNSVELAGQNIHDLRDGLRAGTIRADDANAVLASDGASNTLSAEKRKFFNDISSGNIISQTATARGRAANLEIDPRSMPTPPQPTPPQP